MAESHALGFGYHTVLAENDSFPMGLALGGTTMLQILRRLFEEEQGQDIAEYAVMLAVILVIVVGTVRLIGSNANNVFSAVASSVQ
jgi:Flp pilus assembly pilin Flp